MGPPHWEPLVPRAQPKRGTFSAPRGKSERATSADEQELEGEHHREGDRDHNGDFAFGCLLDRFRQQLARQHPEHRACREAERRGKQRLKLLDEQVEGTASNGCGRLEKMLQPAALRTEAPFGTSTRLIASPSGMLWIAIAIAIAIPKMPVSPKAAPTRAPPPRNARSSPR